MRGDLMNEANDTIPLYSNLSGKGCQVLSNAETGLKWLRRRAEWYFAEEIEFESEEKGKIDGKEYTFYTKSLNLNPDYVLVVDSDGWLVSLGFNESGTYSPEVKYEYFFDADIPLSTFAMDKENVANCPEEAYTAPAQMCDSATTHLGFAMIFLFVATVLISLF